MSAVDAFRFLPRHLSEQHDELTLAERRQLIARTREEWPLASPDSIPLPPHGFPPISDLAVYDGFCCTVPGCQGERQGISRSAKVVYDHIRRVHSGLRANRPYGLEEARVESVVLQTFFHTKRHQRLFVVEPSIDLHSEGDESGEQDEGCEKTGRTQTAMESGLASGHLWTTYEEEDQRSFERLQETTRQDEETPWLRRTGFHMHLVGCHKPWLALAVCWSPVCRDSGAALVRVLAITDRTGTRSSRDHSSGDAAMVDAVVGLYQSQLVFLSHQPARGPLAQQFSRWSVGRQAISNPGTAASRRRYTQQWANALCYIIRLGCVLPPGIQADEGSKEPLRWQPPSCPVVKLAPSQAAAVRELIRVRSASLAHKQDRSSEDDLTDDVSPGGLGHGQERQWRQRLEKALLTFSMSLFMQSLTSCRFVSPLLSYLAATALASDGSWLHPAEYTPVLSRLLKCAQLLLAADAYLLELSISRTVTPDEHLKMQVCFWLANDRDTPLAELNLIRLYGREVARQGVGPSLVTWSQDKQTIGYENKTLLLAAGEQ
ncbi:MAG: hypothetical protein M1816_005836 [Peltula sp. TS41687]|nr:MAG: hypothetical protein M1816_005836 [Peltula sp. TS41687]